MCLSGNFAVVVLFYNTKLALIVCFLSTAGLAVELVQVIHVFYQQVAVAGYTKL